MIKRMTSRSHLIVAMALMMSFSAFAAGQFDNSGDDRWDGTPQKRFYTSEIIATYQCDTCHTIMDRGGTVGPILNQVANRRDEDWLRSWLKDPNVIKPGTKMPTFAFTPEEYEAVVGYLTDMKRDISPGDILASDRPSVEKGEVLFREYDCSGCHRIGSEGRFIGPDLTWLARRKTTDWERTWLADPSAFKPDTFMPNLHLAPETIEHMSAYLETLDGQRNQESREWEFNVNFFLNNRPDRRGELIFRRLACWSCHGEEGYGGIKNPNQKPNEEMPALRELANDFDLEGMTSWIATRHSAEKLDANGPEPPFFCPDYGGVLEENEVVDLYAYFQKLAPKKRVFSFR